jgi:putative aldouronate transport system permease protein
VLFWTKAEYWRPLATLVNVWKGMGWSAIIYLAAIASIDEQLYEAAIIDGAGRLRRIWRITLPNITGIIAVLLILNMGGLVRAGLELGHADDRVFGRDNSKQANGAIGILTDDVVDREAYYVHAVIMALVPFKNPALSW